jgi:hypothetical protein
MEKKTFMFAWNGRRRFIDACCQFDAELQFMERYGFWPNNVQISEVE